MTALEVLKMAFDCGIDIQVQGDNLHLNAKQAPSNQLLAELKQHKSELLLLLGTNSAKPQQRTANDSPPYSTNELLNYYEKSLFHHLLACPYCHIERAEYCVNGYANGSIYDALLLNREDAHAIRESLALRIDKALISGYRRYIPFSIENGDPS